MSTEVEVTGIRECDLHRVIENEPGVKALYDGKTKRGPWANMCQECFDAEGVGLGTGKGQRLIYV